MKDNLEVSAMTVRWSGFKAREPELAEVADPQLREPAIPAFTHHVKPEEVLFELRLQRVLHTIWLKPRQPGTAPIYHRWQP
jgi:hypothetical protein